MDEKSRYKIRDASSTVKLRQTYITCKKVCQIKEKYKNEARLQEEKLHIWHKEKQDQKVITKYTELIPLQNAKQHHHASKGLEGISCK